MTTYLQRTFDVLTAGPAGGIAIGTIYETNFGCRFFPVSHSRRPSRKLHPTPEMAIPRWVKENHAYQIVERKQKQAASA